MSKFLIKGGNKLEGNIRLSGNKNSALKLIPASLIADSPSTLTNVPRIRDIDVMCELVEKLGVKTSWKDKNTLYIDPRNIRNYILDPVLSSRIRASVVLAAPLLVKFGKAVITPPGGDQIGERLLDTHFIMLERFGVEIKRSDGKYNLKWNKKNPANIFLDESSVTATEMGLIIASSINGRSVIKDAAAEPHVEDLAIYLNNMGSNIKGAGTNTLEIKGAKILKGTKHKVIPDHIEGGTFIIASAITNGHLVIEDFIKEHNNMALNYFQKLGIKYSLLKNNRLEIKPSELKALKRKFQTRPWPGFPTDLMSPFIVLATQTNGMILCHDWMYEWRMFFVDDLISMGANILIADPHRVIVNGPTPLLADRLFCKDIRAGISMILAALCAKGISSVENIEMVDRGYEKIESRFNKLGADIKRLED